MKDVRLCNDDYRSFVIFPSLLFCVTNKVYTQMAFIPSTNFTKLLISFRRVMDRMTLYICLMVAVVLSDQLLKFYIQQNVPLNVSYEVIPGVLSIGHVRNFGAAWSMWLGQRWLLSIISICSFGDLWLLF